MLLNHALSADVLRDAGTAVCSECSLRLHLQEGGQVEALAAQALEGLPCERGQVLQPVPHIDAILLHATYSSSNWFLTHGWL